MSQNPHHGIFAHQLLHLPSWSCRTLHHWTTQPISTLLHLPASGIPLSKFCLSRREIKLYGFSRSAHHHFWPIPWDLLTYLYVYPHDHPMIHTLRHEESNWPDESTTRILRYPSDDLDAWSSLLGFALYHCSCTRARKQRSTNHTPNNAFTHQPISNWSKLLSDPTNYCL